MIIKKLAEKYPWIVKWGNLMGSHDYFINTQLMEAEESGAPENALFRDQDEEGEPNKGEWVTTDTLKNPTTRYILGLDNKKPL